LHWRATSLLIGTAKDPKDMQDIMADIQPHAVQVSMVVFTILVDCLMFEFFFLGERECCLRAWCAE
jgi:hypothetical protein